MSAAADSITLPANVRSGHVPGLQLPPPYSARQLLGQLVDVRDGQGNRYLLSETDTHWQLHRRLTPDAAGHARNALEIGPPIGVAKPTDE